MPTTRSVVLAGLAIFLSAGASNATVFTPTLDEFWVIKNDTQIFQDTFNDGNPPPSGPDGGTTYSVFGAGGITGETADDKLTMTPSLGDTLNVSTTPADVGTGGLRLLSVNPNDDNFLGQDSEFSIHGLYDMSSLPSITGQTFGVRATDRVVPLGNQGNNILYLLVGVDLSGDLVANLRLIDIVNGTSTVIASSPIQSFVGVADQIELILEKAADSAIVSASYVLYDANDDVLGSATVGTGTIYDGETYIRAQFFSTDVIPAPATFALLTLGLAGIGYRRHRREKAV